MLNERELEILHNLIEGKKYSYKELSEIYNITDRTVRYNIDNIDYILKILNYDGIKKDKNIISFETEKDLIKLYNLISNSKIKSFKNRFEILKLKILFDKKGLNLTKISEKLNLSRTTIKKDLSLLSDYLNKIGLTLVYTSGKGYKIEGNNQKILFEKLNLMEQILFKIQKFGFEKVNEQFLKYLEKYIKKGYIEIVERFIIEIKNIMKLNIDDLTYNKIFSYILLLLSNNLESNDDLISKNFLLNTDEFNQIQKVLEKIYFEKLEIEKNNEKNLEEHKLIMITDLIMGLSINGFKNNSFENWIDEDLIVKKMISTISKILKKDLTQDEILYNGLLYHIKPTMYRIKNNIQITNSVFQELIFTKDKILDIVKKAVLEIEELFNIKFPEDEIALIGFHIKASIDRNHFEKSKRVILVCGLGYGSSKVLEQSLKEHYDIDIVDIFSYYFIDDLSSRYKDIDLILTTVDLDKEYEVPVIKINSILKEEDFLKLSKYGIKKQNTKVSLKNIIEIIEKNTKIENKNKLLEELKKELGNKLINDYPIKENILNNMLNKNNVKIIEKVNNWKEAIFEGGNLLVKNNIVKEEYIDEMIKMIEKHGAYIIIEEGIAIPHAPISKNVLKMGISLFIVKEKVYFENGKSANIFVSFATKDKNEHKNMLNELFELITNCNFVEEMIKIENYEEVKKYFNKIN